MKHTDKTPFEDAPRNIRIDAGMRLRDVCELTGWTTAAVSRLEHDRRNPTALTLALFYAACGRDDLAEPLMHVLNDQAQDRVAAVVDAAYTRKKRLRTEALARAEAAAEAALVKAGRRVPSAY